MEYTLDYVDGPDAHDEVVEQDGVRVIIAPMAQMFLFGRKSTMKPVCWNLGLNLITQMSLKPADAVNQSSSRVCNHAVIRWT